MANPLDLLKDLAAKFAGIEAALAKVTAAEDRVKALESQLADEKGYAELAGNNLAAELKSHAETKAALQKAQDEVNAKGAEIAALQQQVETEKGRTAATIAAQALPIDQLPTATVTQTITGAETSPGLNPKLKGTDRLLAHFSRDKK